MGNTEVDTMGRLLTVVSDKNLTRPIRQTLSTCRGTLLRAMQMRPWVRNVAVKTMSFQEAGVKSMSRRDGTWAGILTASLSSS